MIDRTRLTRLALAAATLSGFLAACSKPAADVQPPAGAEAAPAAMAEPAPPPPPAPDAMPEQAAARATAANVVTVSTINLSNCETAGNNPKHPKDSIIDYQPTDPTLPVEVRWAKQGNGNGLTVVIKPVSGQSPEILGMFQTRYEIPPTGDSVVSGLPQNPPFGTGKEVRWKFQVQVLNPQGKVICGVDPDVCVRLPGGCSI